MLFGFEDPTEEDLDAPSDEASSTDPPASTRSRWTFAALGLALGLIIGLSVWAFWPDRSPGLTLAEVDARVQEQLAAQQDEPVASRVYNQIAPSVVSVRARGLDANSFEQTGAGVIINDQGHVLTARHLVADSTGIELRFADGTTASAQALSDDPALDIVVLEIGRGGGSRIPATLGNSRSLLIGDPVFAVGNPLGLTSSITTGVISGLQRTGSFPGDDTLVAEDLIQFDAAIHPGSAGGPLLNSAGQVIGIVTDLTTEASQDSSIGIAFAVPIDIAVSQAVDGPSQ